jgi:hypothetical protein
VRERPVDVAQEPLRCPSGEQDSLPAPFERLDAHPISDWTLQQAVRAIAAQAMSIQTLK